MEGGPEVQAERQDPTGGEGCPSKCRAPAQGHTPSKSNAWVNEPKREAERITLPSNALRILDFLSYKRELCMLAILAPLKGGLPGGEFRKSALNHNLLMLPGYFEVLMSETNQQGVSHHLPETNDPKQARRVRSATVQWRSKQTETYVTQFGCSLIPCPIVLVKK